MIARVLFLGCLLVVAAGGLGLIIGTLGLLAALNTF